MNPALKRLNQDGRDMLAVRMPTAISGEADTVAGYSEVFDAALGLTLREETGISDNLAFDPHLVERSEKIQELTGFNAGEYDSATRYADPATVTKLSGFIDRGELSQDGQGQIRTTTPIARSWVLDNPELARSLLAERQARAKDPAAVKTDAEIAQLVEAELAPKRKADQSILARSDSLTAELAGRAVGALRDPLLLGTLPLGFGPMVGKGIAGNAVRAFAAEGAVAGAVEIPIQADIFNFKQQINSPYTAKEAAFNVLAATLGAGVLRAAGSVTVDVAQQALKTYRTRVKAGDAVATDESDAAAQLLQDYVDQVNQSPVGETARTKELERGHFEALDKAAADIEANRPVRVGDLVTGENAVPEATLHSELTARVNVPDERLPTIGRPVRLAEAANTATLERSFISKQLGRSWDEIYQSAEPNQKHLVSIGREIEAEVATARFKNPKLKDRATAEQRAIDKLKQPGEMIDIVRAGFVIDRLEDADAIVRRLSRKVEVLDEDWAVTLDGYFDRKLQVRFKDGTVGEVQIWEPHLLKAKDSTGHSLYKKKRMLETRDIDGKPVAAAGSEKQYQRLQNKMKRLYKDALDQADDSFIDVISRSGDPTSSPKRRKNSASSSARAPSDTSAGEAGIQPREGMNTNAPSAPSSSRVNTAARASQSPQASTERTPLRSDIETTSTKSISQSTADLYDADVVADAIDEARSILIDQDVDLPVEAVMRDGEQAIITRSARDEMQQLQNFIDALDAIDLCRRT